MKNLFAVSFALLFLFFSGCGNNKQVTGKVTFSDGKPVLTGTVIFVSGNFQARGEIEEGSYRLSSLSQNDGLPPGEYKVYVTGVLKPSDGKSGMGSFVSLCDDKYGNESTSGLACKVPVPGNTYDIVLDPHPKNYP